MNTFKNSFVKAFTALIIFPAALLCSVSNAAPINYGDFVGSSVMYIDVTETANSAGDTTPLFSSPTIIGDMLDFNPQGFAASAGGGNTDITDGQLNFMLRGLSGNAITDITFNESGDYTLFGNGTAATSMFYALTISSISVLEIDGIALSSPVFLPGANVFASDDLSGGNELGSLWNLSLNYDVNAGLTGAGILFNTGATRLDIVLNNSLGVISELSSISMVAKKDFRIDVVGSNVSNVPIPASIWLLGSGLFALVGVARRKKGICGS